MKRYDAIDAIRGYAILGVVLTHTQGWIAPDLVILQLIASAGARGVQLFFVASALTIFMSMSDRKQEQNALLNFYIRRFFRIAPAFYVALVIYTVHGKMAPGYWAPGGLQWWHITLTALFLHGWNPETINSVVPGGWSIAVEMMFYVIAPYLFVKLKNIKQTIFALFVALVFFKVSSWLVNTRLVAYYPQDWDYLVFNFSSLWLFGQLPVFLLGILLFHVLRKYKSADSQTAWLLVVWAVFLFFAFLEVGTYRNLLPAHILYAVAFVLFILGVYCHPHKFVVNPITVFIGKLSFSIYLVHFMVLYQLGKRLPDKFSPDGDLDFLLVFLLVLFISVGISYLTYRFIEVPGINLGKKIIGKLNANEAAS